jgi:hypothetical protein
MRAEFEGSLGEIKALPDTSEGGMLTFHLIHTLP